MLVMVAIVAMAVVALDVAMVFMVAWWGPWSWVMRMAPTWLNL